MDFGIAAAAVAAAGGGGMCCCVLVVTQPVLARDAAVDVCVLVLVLQTCFRLNRAVVVSYTSACCTI